MPKIVTIVQARMGSTRLPNKVLLPVLGRPLLSYLIERLKRVRGHDAIVIATTTAPADDAIELFCRLEKVFSFRGSEEDVLERYYEAAKAQAADIVVRVTSDCPLTDPKLVDQLIGEFLNHDPLPDLVSNDLQPSYPVGMGVEVMSMQALSAAHREAKGRSNREHVSPFIWQHPEKFNLVNVRNGEDLSSMRITVDTIEDFEVIRHTIEALYPGTPEFGLGECVRYLRDHPDIAKLNRGVKQKSHLE